MKILMMISALLNSSNDSINQQNEAMSSYNRLTSEGYDAMFQKDYIKGEELLKKSVLYDRFKHHHSFDKLVTAVVVGNIREEERFVDQFTRESHNELTSLGCDAILQNRQMKGLELLKKSVMYDRFKHYSDFNQLVAAIVTGDRDEEKRLVEAFTKDLK